MGHNYAQGLASRQRGDGEEAGGFFCNDRGEAVLFLAEDGSGPVTRGRLLNLCGGAPALAWRLYLACGGRTAPETVLCRDAFKMPGERLFPSLADAPIEIGDAP